MGAETHWGGIEVTCVDFEDSMYDEAAEQRATAIRNIMRSKLSRGEKQAAVKAQMQSLERASNVNVIRSLLDSCDVVEKRLSPVPCEFPSWPIGVCDGDPLIHIFNGIAWVCRCRITGELQVDDQGKLVYESTIAIETASNWQALEFDAWTELQFIQVSHIQHGYYPCSPGLFSRAIFG